MSKKNEKDIAVFVAKENKKCFLTILFSAQKCIFFVQKFLPAIFSFPPFIRCSLRSRLCLCSAKFLYRMGSAYRLHRRTCYTKKEPPRRISEVLKVAATSSPTVFRSAVTSAMLCVGGSAASAASPRHAPVSAHTARPTPSATADTARASEAGLTTPELRLYRPTT